MDKKTKFWCQACGAYEPDACEIIGHRSERMKLAANKWERYSPPRVFDRIEGGTLVPVKNAR